MNFYENESVSLYLQGLENIENIDSEKQHISFLSHPSLVNTPPEMVPLDRTNGAAKPLKWCMVTAAMVH